LSWCAATRYGCLLMTTASIFSSTATCSICTANCRGVLAAPVLAELGFAEIRREYMTQMLFPTEIVTARKPAETIAYAGAKQA
jgi:hypothetical protein